MLMLRSLLLGSVAMLIGVAPTVADAQTLTPPATPNADRLAMQMRRLAENPSDLDALIEAGELSVRLGDPAAALGFLNRAEGISPGNGRVLAGRAAALVALERPGEAMGFFDAAERAGVKPDRMAVDRGLAYDLLGHPEHAQRQYRLALDRGDGDDEVKRRLALSLGISGKVDEAARVLDPLLRRNDRAAWRVRAFTLAMNGDVAQAERIAAGLLPGFGPALVPFFARLSSMGPADRAFAAHFGQLRPTSLRLADARLAPPIRPLSGSGEVALASADSVPRRVRRAGSFSATEEPEVATQPRVSEALSRAAPSSTQSLLGLLQRDKRAPSTPSAVSSRGSVPTRALPQAGRSGPPPPPATPMASPARTGGPAVPASSAAVAPDPTSPTNTPRAADPAVPKADAPAVAAASTPTPQPVDHESNRRVLGEIVRRVTEGAQAEAIPPAPMADAPGALSSRMAPPVSRAAPKQSTVAKPEPAKPKPKPRQPADPARHWVQVAGGANRDDLPDAWERLRKKAPAAFRGKQGWTTPLRATNRLLTGPFKTAAEAQAFVNQLGKEGIAAFAWQSEAGQKVDPLNPR